MLSWLKEHRPLEFPQDMKESWPELKHVSIFTVFHTCASVDIAKKICAQGFAPLCIRDPGVFGHGNYFSMDMHYSASTYGDVEAGCATVIVCDVVLGNVYPVIEDPDEACSSLKGKPGVGNYDSYFVSVHQGPRPCRPNSTEQTVYSELVVFEAIQVLPRCILQIRRK